MRMNYCECARCGRQFDVAPENMPMGTLDHPCYGRLPPERPSSKDQLQALEDMALALRHQIRELRATIHK